jgi:hypothetical protein
VLGSPDRWFKRIPKIIWAGTYLLLVTGGLSILFAGWAYDDPFITYRYADNLSRGLGLVYNPGEQVLSTTSPLFALLLAALHPLWPNLHSLAVLIGAFSLAAGGLCLWDLASHPNLKFTRWVGLLFYPLFPLVNSTLSSETPFYLALCLGAMASYKRRQYRLSALSAILAALTRPDGVLVAVILGLHYLWCHRPSRHAWRQWLAHLPWQVVWIYLGLGLGWVCFAWVYYGSPIPVTLFAKQQQAAVEGSLTFLPGFVIILGWYSSWLYQAEAVLSLPGLVYGLLRLPAMRWLAAWTGLYFASYSLLGVTRYFWYYAPLVPAFVLSFGLSLDGLGTFLRRVVGRKPAKEVTTEVVTTIEAGHDPAREATAEVVPTIGTGKHATTMASRLLPGVLLVGLLVLQLGHLWQMHLAPDPRLPIYRAAGQWLNAHTPAETSVGTLEIGIIGYYAQRPMVDFAGLIQPAIATQLGQSGSYAESARWGFDTYKPDYVVLHQGLFPALEAEVLSRCQHQVTFPAEEYNYTFDMSIYACP